MHVIKASFNGNPNVGLYGFSTGKYFLVGPEVPASLHAQFTEIFQQEVKVATIAGTSLLGVFLAGNESGVLVPDIAYDEEVAYLRDLGITVHLIKTRLTCFGNNVLVSDDFALISPEYPEIEAKAIAKALVVPFAQRNLVGVSTVGSVAVMNAKGCLVHYDAHKDDLAFLKSKFKVHVEYGSVNLGNPYVKSGILLNERGFVIGDLSGGPEIVHADRTFGFIED